MNTLEKLERLVKEKCGGVYLAGTKKIVAYFEPPNKRYGDEDKATQNFGRDTLTEAVEAAYEQAFPSLPEPTDAQVRRVASVLFAEIKRTQGYRDAGIRVNGHVMRMMARAAINAYHKACEPYEATV